MWTKICGLLFWSTLYICIGVWMKYDSRRISWSRLAVHSRNRTGPRTEPSMWSFVKYRCRKWAGHWRTHCVRPLWVEAIQPITIPPRPYDNCNHLSNVTSYMVGAVKVKWRQVNQRHHCKVDQTRSQKIIWQHSDHSRFHWVEDHVRILPIWN